MGKCKKLLRVEKTSNDLVSGFTFLKEIVSHVKLYSSEQILDALKKIQNVIQRESTTFSAAYKSQKHLVHGGKEENLLYFFQDGIFYHSSEYKSTNSDAENSVSKLAGLYEFKDNKNIICHCFISFVGFTVGVSEAYFKNWGTISVCLSEDRKYCTFTISGKKLVNVDVTKFITK